jgi:hypothetical protein
MKRRDIENSSGAILQQRTVYTSIELKSTGYAAAHPAYRVATPMILAG